MAWAGPDTGTATPSVACDIAPYIYLSMLEEIGGMPSRKYDPGVEIRRHAERGPRRRPPDRDRAGRRRRQYPVDVAIFATGFAADADPAPIAARACQTQSPAATRRGRLAPRAGPLRQGARDDVALHLVRALAEAVVARRRAFESIVVDLLSAAVEAGQFRPIDLQLGMLQFLNLHNHTYQWIRSDGRWSVSRLSAEYCSTLFRAFAADGFDPSLVEKDTDRFLREHPEFHLEPQPSIPDRA